MRRLVVLLGAIVFVDTMLYAALTPLLPRYADDYDLSKAGAGLLVAAYAGGALAGGLPGGLMAARLGARAAVLAGLVLVAVASLAFAFSVGPWSLGAARLVQGFGSALTWAGAFAWLVAATPRSRRGEMIGTALSAAIFGALVGPVLGAVASVVGERPAFVGVAVLAAVLFAGAWATSGVAREPQPFRLLGPTLREPHFAGGLWLMLLPSLLFGLLAVLAPLELADYGWSAVAIGAVFLTAAGVEAAMNPFLGRFVDRRGLLMPVRLGLAGSIAVSLALAVAGRPAIVAALVLAAALAYGAFFTPAMALISDGAERRGLAQGLAFGMMNAAWAVGNVVGPAVGGALADLAGDTLPYVLAAAVCAATLAVLPLRTRAAAA